MVKTCRVSNNLGPLPELVVVMRHARMQWAPTPSNVLEPPSLQEGQDVSATADLTGAGRALAETLHEMARAGDRHDRLHFLVEGSRAAMLTCETLHTAYANARQIEQFDCAPAARDIEELNVDPASPYTGDIARWLQQVREKLRGVKEAAPSCERVAVVVVGHDPRMGWLLRDLTGPSKKTLVPALAHTELIACCRTREPGTYLAAWALSPTDSKLEEAVRAKVKSKMDTAKVFAAVLAAVISFVANNISELDGARRSVDLLGLASLGLSTILYLITMFWYDRLLMPTRFWATETPAQHANDWRRQLSSIPQPFAGLRRPPSSSTWVLYQNMQLIWKRCFLPATFAAGAGVALHVAAASEPDGRGGWLALLAGAAVFSIAAIGFGRWSRPNFGVQD